MPSPRFATPYFFLINADNAEFARDIGAVVQRPVLEVATRNVITVSVSDSLGDIATLLADRHLKKAPVVDDSQRVVGVINRSDINRFLVSTYINA